MSTTHILFEFEQVTFADTYRMTLMEDSSGFPKTSSARSFSTGALTIRITSGLQFGKTYYWHYQASRTGKEIYKSGKMKFTIASSLLADTSRFRINVTQHKKEKADPSLIFLDYLGAAITHDGEVVWLTADSAGLAPGLRNLQMTNAGTITFLKGTTCMETDLMSNTLWKAPNDGSISGDRSEYYHHDFVKLPDGTYMACGYKYVEESTPDNMTNLIRVRYNTLIRYDKEGKVIWHWDEKNAMDRESIMTTFIPGNKESSGTHLNGFCFDPADSSFILSFRDISQVSKIDPRTGRFVYQISRTGNGRMSVPESGFLRQHGPALTRSGDIIIYNNNTDGSGREGIITYPSVIIIEQPKQEAAARTLWTYECRNERFPSGLRTKEGYARELPNGNILVCVGGANWAFEITRDKEIVWEAFFEEYVEKENKWVPFMNYRSSFSTSMYPKYFTLEKKLHTPSIPKGTVAIPIVIHNDGSDSDTYRIEVKSKKRSLTPSASVVTIAAGKMMEVNVALKKNTKPQKRIEDDEVSISVFPVNNTSAVRNFVYTIQ